MRLLIFMSSIILLMSCKTDPLKIDVSKINIEKKINRFEIDLFNLKNKDSINSLFIQEKYGQFFRLYGSRVISIGDMESVGFDVHLAQFLNDSLMSKVYNKCQETFPNLNKQDEELTNAFKHFAYYYPNTKLPICYSIISGFNQSVVVAKDYIAISLEKYLGSDCDFYQQLSIPLYARYAMRPENISMDIMLALILTEFDFVTDNDHLLANMIYQGKILYFLKACMPNKSDAELMKYKPEQIKWCENNEAMMWTHVIEQKHLFTHKQRIISKYIGISPFTKGMPQESPGRTGIWIGYQIIKKYMRENENISVQQLMNNNNYEEILRESYYNPSL